MSRRSAEGNEIMNYIKEFKMDSFLNEKLLSQIEIFDFEAYETVMAEQSKTEYLYFLVEGQIKCAHYHSNGTLAVVAMINPFAVLGDVEIINNDLTVTAAVTTLPSIILGIPVTAVQKEGLNDPVFLRFIGQQLVKKLHSSTSLRLGHLLPVKSRLALFILSKPDVSNGKIIIFPEKETLASMLGTTYRHLNRVLKELVEENTIGKGYPGVKIKNRENLQKLID